MLLEELLKKLDPQVVASLRRAIELGKWPNGVVLNQSQRELCTQAVLHWERHNLVRDSRSGYISPKTTPCGDSKPSTDEQKLNWVS